MEQTYPPITLESRRIPLLKKVELRFANRQEPVSEVGINLSMTGIYIRSSVPQSPSSLASFRFRLQEGDEPIEGLAEVVWVREEEEGAYKPAGMGMRFLRVNGDGSQRIRAAVERMIAETEAPPEIRDLRSVVEETLEGILGIEAEEPPQPARRAAPPIYRARESRAVVSRRVERPWWRRLAWVPLLGLLLGSGAFLGWKAVSEGKLGGLPAWWPAQGERVSGKAVAEQGSAKEPAAAVSESSDEAASGPQIAAEPVAGAASAAAADTVPQESGISIDQELLEGAEELVVAWATAWSEQRVGDYLAFYSPSFRPADGSSRSQWEAQRRRRIRAPKVLEVVVQDLETTLVPPEVAWVRFQQSYRGDGYRDTVLKTLSLSLENGRWRIVEERVDT